MRSGLVFFFTIFFASVLSKNLIIVGIFFSIAVCATFRAGSIPNTEIFFYKIFKDNHHYWQFQLLKNFHLGRILVRSYQHNFWHVLTNLKKRKRNKHIQKRCFQEILVLLIERENMSHIQKYIVDKIFHYQNHLLLDKNLLKGITQIYKNFI